MTYRKSMSDAIREVQESTIKPYVSMSMGGQYNVLDKDSKVVYSTRDKILAYDYFKKNFDKLKEDLQETPQGFALVQKAKEIAKKMSGSYSAAVKEIEKLQKGLSDNSAVKDALLQANESLEIDEEVSLQEVSDKLKLAVLKKKIKQYKDKVFKKTMSTIKSPLFAGYEEVEEGRMKDIFTADQEGKSAEEIAKIMKLPLKTVKNILGEEVFEEQILEFTSDMIKRLQKSYATMPQKISPEQAKALSKHLDRLDLASLKQLTKAKIPFVTTLARNKVYKKTGKFEEVEEPKQDMPDDKEKVAKENSDKEIASLKDQIAMLKTKLENEKNKAVKPEPNPKTGEVPLTVGIAHKYFKDKEAKEDVKEAMSDKDKRIQKAKDMIKYYDAQKKAALKGKNKDLAKKMLKADMNADAKEIQTKKTDNYKSKNDDIEESISIKAYKNAVDPSKKGLMISKSGGMSGTIMIKDKKELKDLETKLAQAKRMYTMKEMAKDEKDLEEAMYKVVHATKGMMDIEAKTSYEAAQKFAKAKGLKDTAGVDAHLMKEMAKDDAYAIGMAQAKKSMNDEPPLDKKTITKGHEIAKKILNKEEKRMYIESMAGLKKKSEKSGMSYSILKKVYDRGMAAWKSGHRPGASQQQWAYARVNSFITKSSGTWGGADKDLAKQVKG